MGSSHPHRDIEPSARVCVCVCVCVCVLKEADLSSNRVDNFSFFQHY